MAFIIDLHYMYSIMYNINNKASMKCVNILPGFIRLDFFL
jgi:hypothetical protein